MNNNEKTRRVRKTKDISQKEIAAKLNISQSAVSKIERGHTKLTETKMQKLADSLGVTPEEIKDFTSKGVYVNIEGDNSGSNSNIGIIINELKDHFKDIYEQKLQDKERIIEAKDVALEAKDIVISLLKARINELLEKEK